MKTNFIFYFIHLVLDVDEEKGFATPSKDLLLGIYRCLFSFSALAITSQSNICYMFFVGCCCASCLFFFPSAHSTMSAGGRIRSDNSQLRVFPLCLSSCAAREYSAGIITTLQRNKTPWIRKKKHMISMLMRSQRIFYVV